MNGLAPPGCISHGDRPTAPEIPAAFTGRTCIGQSDVVVTTEFHGVSKAKVERQPAWHRHTRAEGAAAA